MAWTSRPAGTPTEPGVAGAPSVRSRASLLRAGAKATPDQPASASAAFALSSRID
ncbi:hypothetical protein HF313_07075 [Massilia atriviolacea]|uniref:hypothetical protein n=1 Tax=Massilia atriviolacea TaxID=2495579 RepID=UPI0013DFFC3C|nr:hypothetical protein [Massilia atriviolacea]